ncbi:hypothetical protein FZC78_02885 [Rossellomorea vietnamensis]|uniref:Uncharacterized protein n=1 Tax=Rossellomorea vietnamensis TaxID=218284 RepID=A0A5D4NZ21_9BACI|nr:hypothetical protein FZC78_02885 [Rossellomorea vietnamensis]
MRSKIKVLFKISIGLNILLILILAWRIARVNFVSEQVILTEVQDNLVELEGLISIQMEKNWFEPNLVTTELSDVLNGIWLAMTTGKQLGTLSDRDRKILERLHSHLNQYPHGELYRFVDVTQEDKRNFEKLRGILRDVGLGIEITTSSEQGPFMQQAEEFNEIRNSSPLGFP